ncbi:hypothetical protein [Agrobacterium tumefaciens]|uniref:Uncharacterized protein n=1 Tax=Agrobacterium tumefaciens TaxID=358 RepID=A0A2L2LC92_AGRTU|nr:hypothetical protein [Agrobacterium tumefaciens]AVH41876.1 hypothetical protein At1D1609_18220 [Agrobacterium tumefaciens]NSY95795.1 hypothetical protein [Agrobacterium tumefaciens]
MVTDEMVEKAADEMARQDITFANCDRGWQKCTIRAALEAALSAVAPPIRLPTALSLMIEKGVDPEQNGYCRVIDVEKFLCAKLGKEWSATGMSIVSLVDELAALSAQVQDVDERKPLDLNVTKEWFEKRAALEGDHEIGAGSRKKTICIDPTSDELAELFRIAHRIPEGWQLVPVEPTAGMIEAAKSTTSAALTRSHANEIYRAMLAAAPAKQEGGESKPVHKQPVENEESGDE